MTRAFHVQKSAFAAAAANLPETGIGGPAWTRRQELISAFAKAFPDAKWALRGGYIVPGADAEARVAAWFKAQA